MKKIKRLAILTPGINPVPAVEGGAVEQLIENFIIANEKFHFFDIDLYTISFTSENSFKYKYTKLIPISKPNIVEKFYYATKKRFFRVFGSDRIFFYVQENMVRKFKENYYDDVLVENNIDLCIEILKKIKNEKVYFHLHNDFNNGDIAKTNRKVKIILKKVEKVFVVSDFLRNKLQRMDIANNKVFTVYNGVIANNLKKLSNREVEELKTKLKISNNDVVFTYIGRVCPEKGVDKIIDSLLKMNATQRKHIKCLIVGSGNIKSKFFKELKQKIQKVKDNIIYLDYVDNKSINTIYAISDCILIPTQVQEAFSVVALESMVMGKPVIASNSGALPEVLSSKDVYFISLNTKFVSNFYKAMLDFKKNVNDNKKIDFDLQRFPLNREKYYLKLYSLM